MATIQVSPAPGRRVRDPSTMQVIAAGYSVDDADPYWYKRVQDGDVTIDGAATSETATAADPVAAELKQVEGELAKVEASEAAKAATRKTAAASAATPAAASAPAAASPATAS